MNGKRELVVLEIYRQQSILEADPQKAGHNTFCVHLQNPDHWMNAPELPRHFHHSPQQFLCRIHCYQQQQDLYGPEMFFQMDVKHIINKCSSRLFTQQ